MILSRLVGFNPGLPVHLHPSGSVVVSSAGNITRFSSSTAFWTLRDAGQGDLCATALSRSGELFCGSDAAGRVSLWRVSDRDSRPLRGEMGCKVTVLSFSHDGAMVAAGGVDGRVTVFDTTGLKPAATARAVAGCAVQALSFAPESTVGATGHTSYTLMCAGSGSGCEVVRLTLSFDKRLLQFALAVAAVAGSANKQRANTCGAFLRGGVAVTGTGSGEMSVFNLNNLVARRTIPVGGGVSSIAECGGSSLLLGCTDGCVRLVVGSDQDWRVASSVQVGREPVVSLAMSGDGLSALGATLDGQLLHLDLGTLGAVASTRVSTSPTAPILALDISSQTVATAASNCRATYDAAGMCLVRRATPAGVRVTSVLAQDGLGIVWGFSDGSLELTSPHSLETLYRIASAHRGAVTSIAAVPGAVTITAGEDGTVRVWPTANGKLPVAPALTFQDHKGPVTRVAVDLSSSTTVHSAGAHDRNLLSYDLKAGRKMPIFHQNKANLTGLAQLPHGDLELVTVDSAGRLEIWDKDEQAPVAARSLRLPRPVTCLAARGPGLALGLDDGTVIVLRASPQGPPREVTSSSAAHSGPVAAIAWASDTAIVSTGQEGHMAVWELAP